MSRRRLRQFEVTHTATGIATRVMVWEYWGTVRKGWGSGSGYADAARKAGHRYLVDCSARLVPVGQEIPLPFDDCPLVLRRKLAS